MFKRIQSGDLASRISEPRDKIQVISGPRQVGKSTMVKQVLQETTIPHMLVSADNVEKTNTAWIGEMWATSRARMKVSTTSEFLLVIDEVHKLDNWSEAVKKEWDEDTYNDLNMKVVLLGSSRLLLKDGLTESLAGRYELIRMPHWSYSEMHEAFNMDVNQYIYFGGYPGGAKYIEDERRWRRYIKDSIVAPAIERDVVSFLQMESNAPIGLWPELEYVGEEIDDISGQKLFVYTDGLNEAENQKQEQFTEERLIELLQAHVADTARQTIEALVDEVERHRDGAEPSDDLTMLCFRIKGRKNIQ